MGDDKNWVIWVVLGIVAAIAAILLGILNAALKEDKKSTHRKRRRKLGPDEWKISGTTMKITGRGVIL